MIHVHRTPQADSGESNEGTPRELQAGSSS